jgi:hypothetical protein
MMTKTQKKSTLAEPTSAVKKCLIQVSLGLVYLLAGLIVSVVGFGFAIKHSDPRDDVVFMPGSGVWWADLVIWIGYLTMLTGIFRALRGLIPAKAGD